LARGDSFGTLWLRVITGRMHEIEVTHFVHELTTKPEVPVDGFDFAVERYAFDTGFFLHFSQCSCFGCFRFLEVSLGKSPIAIAVANEQEHWFAFVHAIHDTARRRFERRAR